MASIQSYLDSGVNKTLVKRSVREFNSFLKEIFTTKDNFEKSWKRVKRDHIMDIKGEKYSFRDYLKENVKSNKSKNSILLMIKRLFDYFIMEEMALTGLKRINPVDLTWDRFEIKVKHGTTREMIPQDVLSDMREFLKRDNFAFAKDRQIGFMLYLLMTFPLRSKQVQLLDRGNMDELVYARGEMVKNKDGVKGRREGFLQMDYYNGVEKDKGEILYINTNKNSSGFFIPWVSNELIYMINQQRERVWGRDGSLLFCNEKGVMISKNRIYKLWKRLCGEFGLIIDGKPRYDLHSLRVSGVSSALDMGIDRSFIGKNLSGQTVDIVLHYAKIDDLQELINEKEIRRLN